MPSVNVLVLSPDTRSERVYDLSLSIGELKRKLVSVSGIPVESQRLSLAPSESRAREPSVSLDDDTRPIGYFSVANGMVLKVEDLHPDKNRSGQFTDPTSVDKFELSQEEYEARPGTVRSYKERMKMGRFADRSDALPSHPGAAGNTISIKLGSRCRLVNVDGSDGHRGSVRYVGATKFGTQDGSQWVGIELDEPFGKNDGSVDGTRYFSCHDRYGVFRRPGTIETGDFPNIDLDSENEI